MDGAEHRFSTLCCEWGEVVAPQMWPSGRIREVAEDGGGCLHVAPPRFIFYPGSVPHMLLEPRCHTLVPAVCCWAIKAPEKAVGKEGWPWA